MEGGEYYDFENKVNTFWFVWYSQDCSSHQKIDNEVIGVEEYHHHNQLLEKKSVQGSWQPNEMFILLSFLLFQKLSCYHYYHYSLLLFTSQETVIVDWKEKEKKKNIWTTWRIIYSSVLFWFFKLGNNHFVVEQGNDLIE